MVNFPIDEAYLIGAWCSSALWGMLTFLVIYCLSFIVPLIRSGNVNKTHYVTTIAVIVLYMLSTTHLSLALRRLIEGFIYNPGNSPFYFANIGIPLNRGKDEIYVTSMIIADSVIVWRCWVVWGQNNLVIALPVSMVLGTTIAGYVAVAQYFLANPDPRRAVNWGTAMFAMSLSTNVLVTLMTAGRIWWLSRWVGRDHAGPMATRYRAIVLLIIESGAVISAAKIVEFGLFRLTPGDVLDGLHALYIVYEMLPHLNAIMPTIIIIAVNAGKALDDAPGTKVGVPSTNIMFARGIRKTVTTTTDYELETRRDMNAGLQNMNSVSQMQFEESKVVLSPRFSDLEEQTQDASIANKV